MPLHWAASGGHNEIVKFLLDHGVPVDEKDDVSSPNVFTLSFSAFLRCLKTVFLQAMT